MWGASGGQGAPSWGTCRAPQREGASTSAMPAGEGRQHTQGMGQGSGASSLRPGGHTQGGKGRSRLCPFLVCSPTAHSVEKRDDGISACMEMIPGVYEKHRFPTHARDSEWTRDNEADRLPCNVSGTCCPDPCSWVQTCRRNGGMVQRSQNVPTGSPQTGCVRQNNSPPGVSTLQSPEPGHVLLV